MSCLSLSKISVNCPRWVNYKGSILTEAQEMADNAHITQEFVSSIIAGETFADASLLAFRESSSFRAGGTSSSYGSMGQVISVLE